MKRLCSRLFAFRTTGVVATFKAAQSARWAVVVVALASASAGCKTCKSADTASKRQPARVANDDDRDDDDDDDQEDRDNNRDNFWRAKVLIMGDGTVSTVDSSFDCRGDGAHQTGSCGPALMKFNELRPPLMRAFAAPDWRFDHWESTIVEPNGTTHSRTGPMPDGDLYLNGFGYVDTGELEHVTAVFVSASHERDDARVSVHSIKSI